MKCKDLVWREHGIRLPGHKIAKAQFANGYGASVVIGSMFYSNGVDTYEVAVETKDGLAYDTPITNDVLGHLTEAEVDEALAAIEALPPRRC